jgi:hypothetical protein
VDSVQSHALFPLWRRQRRGQNWSLVLWAWEAMAGSKAEEGQARGEAAPLAAGYREWKPGTWQGKDR